MTPRIGSLCTGYGGLDMAVMDVLDAKVAWHAETDPGASAVLAHHHPEVPNLGDITAIDWRQVEPVDVLTAGFPCQDISNADQRAGIEGKRSGIWSNVVAAVGVRRPRYAVFENVAAVVVRGLGTVLADLAAVGFDAEWLCLRASDVGAAHRRERWFCLAWPAHTPGPRLETRRQGRPGGASTADAAGVGHEWDWSTRDGWSGSAHRRVAVADSAGVGRGEGRPEPARQRGGFDVAERVGTDWGVYGPAIARWEHVTGRRAPAPTEPGSRGGQRLSARFTEWLMGLPAGWVTDTPGLSRNQALRCLGNGVVPQQGAAAVRMLLERAR